MFAELKHTIEAELGISLSLEKLFGADIDGIAEEMLGQIETAAHSMDGTASLERLRDRKYAPASYSQEQIWLIQELVKAARRAHTATAGFEIVVLEGTQPRTGAIRYGRERRQDRSATRGMFTTSTRR